MAIYNESSISEMDTILNNKYTSKQTKNLTKTLSLNSKFNTFERDLYLSLLGVTHYHNKAKIKRAILFKTIEKFKHIQDLNGIVNFGQQILFDKNCKYEYLKNQFEDIPKGTQGIFIDVYKNKVRILFNGYSGYLSIDYFNINDIVFIKQESFLSFLYLDKDNFIETLFNNYSKANGACLGSGWTIKGKNLKDNIKIII